MNDNFIQLPPQPTFRQRLRLRLLPWKSCELPQPVGFEDMLVTRTFVKLSVIDRLRILITGICETETRIATEHVVGKHKAVSVFRSGHSTKKL